ncbi:MAG: hypothetical protein JW860_16365 [Sedimentisphaerales bacterium]|nr:hypothetical protein [Sedimentisphaerales bacterium]
MYKKVQYIIAGLFIWSCTLDAQADTPLWMNPAYNPVPAYKETVVANNILTQGTVTSVTLRWQAGGGAVSHDVYLGTDFTQVNDADRSDTSGIYQGEQAVMEYGPIATRPDTTYYWRVDGINGPDICKGDVWSFSVPYYFYSGEDFESYRDPNILKLTWNDGTDLENSTGSTIDLETDNSLNTVHEGQRSLRFDYDNNGSTQGAYHSEIHGQCIVQNWTKNNIKALTLYFYGHSENSLEPMYVALEDESGTDYAVYYPHLTFLSEPWWHVWNIDLAEFYNAGLDMTHISSIYLGFGDRNNPVPGGSGTIYFDDIRLHQSRCVSEYSPDADLNHDCIMDNQDLAFIIHDWLSMSLSSGDINNDLKVNLEDFAELASAWLDTALWP